MGRPALPLLVLMLSLVAVCRVFAAGGDIVWQASDLRSGKQYATAATGDGSGNMIVTGYQNLAGDANDDYWTVKFKADGSGVAWRAALDLQGGTDQARAVTVDANNDVIVTGFVWNGNNRDILTVKYDGASGTVIWQRTFDGTAHGSDIGTAIAVDSLNNVYVGGNSQNSGGNDDYALLKYAPDGTPLWQVFLNGSGNDIDQLTDIACGSDGIAVTGKAKSGSRFSMLSAKFAADGTKIWEKSYTASGDASGKKVRLDAAGNVVVTGSAFNDTLDIYTVKYRGSDGEPLWERTYSGVYDEEPYGLALDTDGEIYLTGYTWTESAANDFYTARYNGATGAVVWEKLYDSGNGATDVAIGTAISVLPGGDLFVAGYTSTAGNIDTQTVKYKRENGNELWRRTFNGTAGKNDLPVAIALTGAGEPLVGGWSDNGTDLDYFVIKYDPGAINPPTELTAVTVAATSIHLTWHDNAANEDGFILERKKGESGSYAQIATLAANTTSYTDSDPALESGNYYFYRLKATSATFGDSLFSNETHALTLFIDFQPPAWSYLYNSPDNMDDYVTAIAVGPDNQPVVTGYSQRSVGGFDYLTKKLNRADKSLVWSDLYDDPDAEMDVAKCLAVDGNNNALVSGFSQLFYAPAEKNINSIYTIKYRADSPAVDPPVRSWGVQYNGPGGIDDRASAIATTTDSANNVVILGYGKNAANNDDIYLVKYAADGSRLWAIPPFDHGADDIPSAVVVAADGSVYITGYSEKSPNSNLFDFFTAKYRGSDGALLWSDIYSVVAGGNNQGHSLALDASGDLYVTGFATNAAGNRDIYTIKYSGSAPTATRIWEQSLDGNAHGDDEGVTVKVDPIDDDIVVGGTVLTTANDHDVVLVRYDTNGTTIGGWPLTVSRHDNDDYLKDMAIDASGYLYLAADTSNGDSVDIFALIYNHEGVLLGATSYNGAANSYDEATAITVNRKGEAFVGGYSTNAAGNADYLVLKQTNGFLLVPSPFVATPQADSGKINLTWADNNPGTTFTIERTLGPVTPASTWSPIASSLIAGTISYQDSGLNPGTSYCYRIEAVSGTLFSRKLVACTTTTLTPPLLNPVAVVSPTAIDLSWNTVAGNSGFSVERSTNNSTWTQVGSNLPADTLSLHDTGLTAGTVYYYRVRTLSSAGASLPSAVQAAPVLTAQSVAPTAVTLGWPAVSGATGYRIERSPDNSSWSQIATPAAGATTYNDGTLAPVTTYYFRMLADTASGTSGPSLSLTVTTPLAAPALAAPTAVSTSRIDLGWGDVTAATGFAIWEKTCLYNGNSGYDINYCSAANSDAAWAWSDWVQVDAVGQGVTGYQRSGLVPGYAYQYYVTALAGGTSSPPSSSRYIRTIPDAPALNAPSAPTDTSVVLSWSDVAGDNGYTLERKLGAGSFSPLTTVANNTVGYTDTTVVGETSYTYRVKANGVSAPSAFSNEQSVTTPAPGPTIASVTATAAVTASWNAVSGASSYEVRRSTFTSYDRPDLAGNPTYASYWNAWTTVATTSDTSYVDTDVTEGYTYKYSVRALVAGSYSGWGSDGGKFATTIPPVPANLAATGSSATQINLSWSNVYGETNFARQYKEKTDSDCSAGTWIETTGIAMNSLSSAVVSLAPATTSYCFQVRAYNTSGSSAWSSTVAYLPPPALNAPTGITQSAMDLSWNNVGGNSGYTLERSTNNFTSVSGSVTRSADVTTYTDSNLAANTTYYYRIKTKSGTAVSLPSNIVSATTQSISTPVLDSLSGITTSQITLNWTGVTGNTGYKVERSPDNAAWTQIATPVTNDVTYTNTGLSPGTRYYYRVSSRNAQGSYSAPSNVLSATTLLPTPSLTGTPVSAARIDLSWQVVYGATAYKLLRSVGPDGPWSQVANPAVAYAELYCGSQTLSTITCQTLAPVTASYSDSSLNANTGYCYQLLATSAIAPDSAPSATVCSQTSALGTPVLTGVTAASALKIALTWSYDPAGCSPNGCATPDGFEVWKQLWNGTWNRIASLGNVASHIDTVGIEPSRSYRYKVRAIKGGDASAFSAPLEAVTPAYGNGSDTCP